MFSWIKQFVSKNNFKGIYLPNYKYLSNQKAIHYLADSEKYYIALNQRDGNQAIATVTIGQRVNIGEVVAKPLSNLAVYKHSPVSGVVSAITTITETHPSKQEITAIEITKDKSLDSEKKGFLAPINHFSSVDKAILIKRIEQCGITGMGGAGFPTEKKVNIKNKVKTLIINGAESEPYITCDDLLMRERAEGILKGAQITAYLLSSDNIYIGIEQNKPQAIQSINNAIIKLKKENQLITSCEVKILPSQYPMGSRHQISQYILGHKTDIQKRSYESGFVCQNVATVYAIYEAIYKGKPLIERLVTISGKGFKQPAVYQIKIGTPIKYLLEQLKLNDNYKDLVINGTMMGFSLPINTSAVIKKETIGILAINHNEIATKKETIRPNLTEQACIRCGLCANVCPQNLLPQQLQFYGKAKQYHKAEENRVMDCIECGLCSYVCPSNIPLVPIFQHTKGEIKAEQLKKENSQHAKIRFENRNLRLDNEKKFKQEQLELRRKQLKSQQKDQSSQSSDSKKDLIAKAIAKAQAKKTNP